jgi:hypothetical protein
MAERFLALLREDAMMGLLLGVSPPLGRAGIAARAAEAATVFLDICLAPKRSTI